MTPKLKSFIWSEQTFLAVLLCLTGIISFFLGRSSVETSLALPTGQQNKAEIIFVDAPVEPPEAGVGEAVVEAMTIIASRNGTKYHLPTCSGAKSIKEENKIYFNSIEEAKAAGYTPAANCTF